VKRTRRRSPSYGPADVELLRRCCLVTDGICSKRLAPFLPELPEVFGRRQALREFPIAVHAHVAGMRAATLDRALKPLREQRKARRGISTTRAGTLLKRQIPVRTLTEWTDARPRFFEMDLVAPGSWSGAGQFSVHDRSASQHCHIVQHEPRGSVQVRWAVQRRRRAVRVADGRRQV
jgi:hypothetical protein